MVDKTQPTEVTAIGTEKPQLKVPTEVRTPTAGNVRDAGKVAEGIAQRTIGEHFGTPVIEHGTPDATPVRRGMAPEAKMPAGDRGSGPPPEGKVPAGDRGSGSPPDGSGDGLAHKAGAGDRDTPNAPNARESQAPTDEQIQQTFGKYASDGKRLNGTGDESQYNWFRPNAVETGRFGTIDQADYTPQDPKAAETLAKLPHVPLPEGAVKNDVYVDQANFATAPLDVGLHTSDLETCAGLVVVDKNKGKQFLAHIDKGVTPDQIKKSLQGFDLADPGLKVYLLPGRSESTVPAAVTEAFMGTPAASKMQIVDWSGGPERRGIAVYNGEIVRGPNKIGQEF